MDVNIAHENTFEKISLREVYVNSLIEIAEKNDKVVAVDADLMLSLGMKPFIDKFPQRAINAGVQEANMIGVAAGLSLLGFVPYAHTFACFASRRVCDQIFISCSYAKLNVRIIGSDPGITATLNGGTHMTFEDIGIMRTIPNVTILEPTDSTMLRDLVSQTADLYGVFYMRLIRKVDVKKVYEDGSHFTIGKAVQLREGRDITIIATGYCVGDSIEAANQLEEKGISAKLLNIFTIKPIDREAIIAAAEETGAIITVENHNIINGLGSAVAEVLSECAPTWLERIGARDEFGEVGQIEYLKERYGLTPNKIVAAAERMLSNKKNRNNPKFDPRSHS